MTDKKKDEYIAVNDPKTGLTRHVLKSDLENPEKWVIVTDQNGKQFAITKADWDKEMRTNENMRGCMLVIIFVMLFAMVGGLVYAGIDLHKANKKHPNVISGIYEKDKRIIISDVYTGEERMIKYDGINDNNDNSAFHVLVLNFQNRIKYSKVGDTVMFISPWYEDEIIFDLGPKTGYKNGLQLNKDSINARMAAAKHKQDMDSLLYQKQR